MSHMYQPQPWQPVSSEREAEAYLNQHRVPQYEVDRIAQQAGGVIGDVQRRQHEEMAGILQADRMAREAAGYPHAAGQFVPGVSPMLRYGPAPVFPPGPVPRDYKTRQIHWPQPAAPARDAPTYTAPPRPAATSTPVHPGVVAVIVLVILAILGAAGNAAYKRINHVTPAEMGIQTKSAVTWTHVPEIGSKFHYVDFRIETTNTSDEERKVEYCARKYSDAPDVCITYKASPHNTSEVLETRAVQVERDNDALDGPTKRVVKVDGFYVTD